MAGVAPRAWYHSAAAAPCALGCAADGAIGGSLERSLRTSLRRTSRRAWAAAPCRLAATACASAAFGAPSSFAISSARPGRLAPRSHGCASTSPM
eukprot:7379290-Prymnesium_polylepis.1